MVIWDFVWEWLEGLSGKSVPVPYDLARHVFFEVSRKQFQWIIQVSKARHLDALIIHVAKGVLDAGEIKQANPRRVSCWACLIPFFSTLVKAFSQAELS